MPRNAESRLKTAEITLCKVIDLYELWQLFRVMEIKDIKNEVENSTAKYTLEELLESVNEGILHEETDFGEPVGKEIVDYKD